MKSNIIVPLFRHRKMVDSCVERGLRLPIIICHQSHHLRVVNRSLWSSMYGRPQRTHLQFARFRCETPDERVLRTFLSNHTDAVSAVRYFCPRANIIIAQMVIRSRSLFWEHFNVILPESFMRGPLMSHYSSHGRS